MPTFFLISGLFARRALVVEPSVFRARKVWLFLWVYALWSIVYLALYESIGLLGHDGRFLRKVDQWLAETLTLNSGLWYLVALPAFFVAARLLRAVPSRTQIAAAGVVSFTFSCGLVHTQCQGEAVVHGRRSH
jgi:uncharacterized membrane protein YcfT